MLPLTTAAGPSRRDAAPAVLDCDGSSAGARCCGDVGDDSPLGMGNAGGGGGGKVDSDGNGADVGDDSAEGDAMGGAAADP